MNNGGINRERPRRLYPGWQWKDSPPRLCAGERAPIEVLNFPEHLPRFRATLVLGLGEAFEEEQSRKLAIKQVTSPFFTGCELILQVVLVAVIYESFLLKEV